MTRRRVYGAGVLPLSTYFPPAARGSKCPELRCEKPKVVDSNPTAPTLSFCRIRYCS